MQRFSTTFIYACAVMALLNIHLVESRFNFMVPGRWGNGAPGKRNTADTSYPSQMLKGAGECDRVNLDTVYVIYRAIQDEAARLARCQQQSSDDLDTPAPLMH
nr:AKH [Urechis unicinctus]